jgi:hypothetical protein
MMGLFPLSLNADLVRDSAYLAPGLKAPALILTYPLIPPPSNACFAAELAGAQEELVEATEEPVVSVRLITPGPATKDSEKYKSKLTEAGEESHSAFAGEYGILLPVPD